MTASMQDIEAVARQHHTRNLHESPARQLGCDQQVAANRNPLSGNSGFDGVKLFAKVQADQTGKIGNMLVALPRGGLPMSPGWRLGITRRPPNVDQRKLTELDRSEGLSRSSNQLGVRNHEESIPR